MIKKMIWLCLVVSSLANIACGEQPSSYDKRDKKIMNNLTLYFHKETGAQFITRTQAVSSNPLPTSTTTFYNLDWDKLYEELNACHLKNFADVMTSICIKYLGLKLNNPKFTLCKENGLVDLFMHDLMCLDKGLPYEESFVHKIRRICNRLTGRLWKFRKLNSEKYLIALWNNFAFSSYLNRSIEL